MSRAYELSISLDMHWLDYDRCHPMDAPMCEAAAAELRRLSAVEAELAECKAAYESQFKELHSLKSTLAASCDDEREQLWEATLGGGCSRALDAERELEALKKAISEAEPVAWMSRASLVNCEIDRARYGETGGDTYTSAASRNPFHDTPLYTLKGIK